MDNIYFANKEAKDTCSILLAKAEHWQQGIKSNGLLDKMRNMWRAYHGAYYSAVGDGHEVSFSGEQGELTNLPVNHFRNIASHMLNMTTANRPSLEARATSTDYKSLVQTTLANNILEYYLREKRLETVFKRATEYAIVFGSGFIKMEWNATAGDIYDVIEENGQEIPLYNGDIEFETISPFDVLVDTSKDTWKMDWVVVRTWKNKYDLAAKYPEYADQIVGLKTKSEEESMIWGTFNLHEQTDDIAVYEFFHRRTDAVSNGRYILFLTNEIILQDRNLPYRIVPVFRISAGEILGTPHGYSPLYDILPIQEAINTLYSTVLTNQSTFGVQNIWIKRGADISVNNLQGGLNVIESLEKPEPINLTQTPKEIFTFIEMLERVAETLSGVNSVTRGNPEASLKSGAALALVQSMALQFMSGLQQSYVQIVEDVGTAVIKFLQDFAESPRLIAIAGKDNRSRMKEFINDDIENISRVVVDMGNPLARCLAKDTPILMYDGSVKMVQDVKIGDLVMGPDSSPRTVENVNSGTEMMYEITSKDKNRNIKYGCNESHILTLKYCSDDSRYDVKRGDIIDISISDYLDLPARQRRLLQGFTTAIEFEKKEVPVPAYILGLWLGDGNSNNTCLTSMDDEIVSEWKEYAESIGMEVRVSENRQPNKSKNYFITSGKANGRADRNPLMNHLRGMELIDNKHIPEIYLNNTRKTRLNLLAGLIDTDGYRIDETFIFTQKSERLSNDVIRLGKSLGFRVTSKKVKSSSSKLCPNVTGEVYKITIGGNTDEIPTRLPRKQAAKKDKARDWLNYGIEVTQVGEGTYYGFTLLEEPHFVLGDFTVTHNTTAGRVQIADNLLQYQLLKSPQQYINVLNTGRLDILTDDIQHELLLIQAENEKIIEGEVPIVTVIDDHQQHIIDHRKVLADPDLRKDPLLVGRAVAHIQEHINQLRTADPDLLVLLKQQPLQPKPTEGMPSPEAVMQPPNQGLIGANVNNEEVQMPGMAEATNLPNMPTVPADALPNPEIQEQQMGNVR